MDLPNDPEKGNLFPSTHKFFTFRYGDLWCATTPTIQNKPALFPINIKDKNHLLKCDPDISNFEFNSTKSTAFIQYKTDIYIYVGLRNCSFKKDNVKCAHFSSRFENHLFILDINFVLRIFDIKKGDYITNCSNQLFEIKDVENFAVFPKLNQNHYLAIISKDETSHKLLYIDAILLEGQAAFLLSNNINIPPTMKIKDGLVQESTAIYSPIDIFFPGYNSDFDIIVDNTNVFVGSHQQMDFQQDKIYVAVDEEKEIKEIGEVYNFQGFIENNGIFAMGGQKVYLLSKNNLIQFHEKEAICVSISPHIISLKFETIYIKGETKISVYENNEVTTPCEDYKKLRQYENDSFFTLVNIVKVRGEKLQRRQEQFEEKLNQLVLEISNKKFTELKDNYEKLYTKLTQNILPYNMAQIDALYRESQNLETEIKIVKQSNS